MSAVNAPKNAKLLVSVVEAAEMRSIGRSTAYRLVDSGELRTVQMGNGRSLQRVRVSEIERLIDARTF
jgi:excisionase family DNA binding protein